LYHTKFTKVQRNIKNKNTHGRGINLNKKIKKGLVTAVSAAMSAGIIVPAVAVLAAPVTVPVTRLGGATRYATAAALATANGKQSDNVVLVSGEGAYDAISATALASKLNAPILMTTPGTLNADTAAALKTLGAKTIYVIGGNGSVSQAVRNGLKTAYTLVELGGADRYATNLQVANYLVNTEKVSAAKVLVAGGAGFADALSVAPVAAADGEILLLANSDATSMIATNKFVKDNSSAVTVVGTTNVISDTEKAALNGATRVDGGADRFATNLNVNKAFAADLTADTTYVASATGEGFADALVGAAAAGVTKSPLILVDTNGTSTATTNAIAYLKTLAPKTAVNVLGGTGVITADTFNAISDAVNNVATGDLAVSSVTAISATSFKVTFNQAPADTSKISATVLQGTSPVTTTATWNAANTEETVTSASNLPAATYTVDVKNDTTDLGTTSVVVSQQKIAKINITSTKLGVNNNVGYVTYSVLDQYGNDITKTSLGNGITFQSGVGSITSRDGLIKITANSGLQLITFSTVVITGFDSTSGVSTSATLTTSTQVGTLSDITVGTALTNVDNKVLTANDTTDIFYLPYTALDISGNPTTNYDLVRQGLITDTNGYLTTSSSYVTAQVIEDPTDSSKAVIQVVATTQPDVISMDIPVVITAMTWTGKTSALNVTLKKAAAVDSFILNAPAADVATGENAEIPFTAVDQNGAALTQYTDLAGKVTLNNAYFTENADGTAKLLAGPSSGAGFTTKGTQIITAMTPTGKYSSLTLNIQDTAVADTLTVSPTIFVNAMEKNAQQGIDFGFNDGGLSVKDQYGRNFDMTGSNIASSTTGYSYKVVATTTGAVTVSDQADATNAAKASVDIYSGKGVFVNAGSTAGTGTVTFKLEKIALDGTVSVVDTKTQVLSVLNDTDIKGYTLGTVASAIYAGSPLTATAGTVTARMQDYKANPGVFGTTSSGSKVVLSGTPVTGAYVSDTTNFVASQDGKAGDVKVFALTPANSVATEAATLTVTVKGTDNLIHSLTTPITSSTAAPVAASMTTSVDTTVAGVSVSGDTITVNSADLTAAKLIAGKSFGKYDTDGASNNATIYFAPLDQYGQTSAQLAQVILASSVTTGTTTASNPGNVVIDNSGKIVSGSFSTNTTYTITGVTSNGLIKTIQLVIQ
jgi:putative cell wall-binding protein